jgi:hypothetical protein
MWLSKGNNKVVFDLKIKTKEGCIFVMYMHRDGVEVAALQAETHRKINIDKAHQLLGHMSNDTTRARAEALGWEIMRESMQPCESCAVGKAEQKNVPRRVNTYRESSQEREFIWTSHQSKVRRIVPR